MRQPRQKKFFHQAQSLLEAIVAIGVLMTGIFSVLTLAKSSQRSVKISSGHLIASNLGREGIEVARAIRDSNWLSGAAWDNGLYSGTDYTAAAVFDPSARTWSLNFTPNAIANARLNISSSGVYGVSSGTPTVFYRLLTLTPVGSPVYMIKAICQIQWLEPGGKHDIFVEDWLYNWK